MGRKKSQKIERPGAFSKKAKGRKPRDELKGMMSNKQYFGGAVSLKGASPRIDGEFFYDRCNAFKLHLSLFGLANKIFVGILTALMMTFAPCAESRACSCQ